MAKRQPVTPGRYRLERDGRIYDVKNEVKQPGYDPEDAETYVVAEDEDHVFHLFSPWDFRPGGVDQFHRVV